MAPHADEFEQENLSSTDDDSDDEGLKEDMAALAEVLRKHGPDAPAAASRDLVLRPDSDDARDPLLDAGDAIVSVGAVGDSLDSDSDSDEDLRCLQRVESLYKPLSTLPPLPPPTMTKVTIDNDDDEDDVETLRAILKRFSDYNVGRSPCVRVFLELKKLSFFKVRVYIVFGAINGFILQKCLFQSDILPRCFLSICLDWW